MSNPIEESNLSQLKRADFKKNINGKDTDLFILKNNKGCEVAFTNYGGALVSIMMPDRDGRLANVVETNDSIDHVVGSHECFLSTIIGRYGNRIRKGKFTLDGEEYTLAINNDPNALHGGPTGFHTKVWDAQRKDDHTVELHYLSADGEEGFPGNLDVYVTYTLTDENEFVIVYKAKTDKKTLVNLTHHAFFCLAGAATPTPSVLNNIVTLNADFYTPMDAVSIPTGEILSVKGTPMDFTTPHAIGERIDSDFEQLKFGLGYDHNYVLNKREPGELSFAAKCVEPVSGRSLEVYTTEPGLQMYTGNFLDGFEGSHGCTFPRRSAVCFEAQHFPDSPNNPHFPDAELNPGEIYQQVTVYKFGVEK